MGSADLSRAVWRKSSRSGGSGDCVEIAWSAIRDSKNADGPLIEIPARSLALFLSAAKRSGFTA